MLKDYCRQLKDISENSRKKHYSTIRGFYYRNQCKLPESPLKSIGILADREIKKNDGNGTAQKIFVALRKILSVADARDRAILLTMLQGGIDESTLAGPFNTLAYSQLVEELGDDWRKWNLENAPVRVQIYRPKTGKQFYTFLAHDAIKAIKEWLSVRFNLMNGKDIAIYHSSKQGNVSRSDPIFLTHTGKPIASTLPGDVFRTLAFKSGVNQKQDPSALAPNRGSKIRYELHSHEVRDTLK
ncbi:MAG: hypothetical protein ACRDF4_04550, partial [Rhabdochlamydiaceae bacterium]